MFSSIRATIYSVDDSELQNIYISTYLVSLGASNHKLYRKHAVTFLHNIPFEWCSKGGHHFTLFSKCWVTTSLRPEYSLSPCLWRTIVYALRYSSSKLSPLLFFFWISWIAFLSSCQMFSTYRSSIVIWWTGNKLNNNKQVLARVKK